MISGAHIVVYSKNAEADRAFFRDVLGLKSVDAGHGWLIFALPPAEAAFHPSEEETHELNRLRWATALQQRGWRILKH
jgi:catechol 2,3-dioxygenase-like lactoylglutathione lyase family enzyme